MKCKQGVLFVVVPLPVQVASWTVCVHASEIQLHALPPINASAQPPSSPSPATALKEGRAGSFQSLWFLDTRKS